ncbi:MAG: tRNA adenosine(34) deaminase TadA, partial [Anaerolineae bacterium]
LVTVATLVGKQVCGIILQLMNHDCWMHEALNEAYGALAAGEIPVGAVVVWQNQIIGRGRNRREELHDPTAHAEILALREAGQSSGDWRLSGTLLYCTLEPCSMCAGALVNARVETLVYGLPDDKAGSAGSIYDLVRSPWLNHRCKVVSGILSKEILQMMQQFFINLRQDKSER